VTVGSKTKRKENIKGIAGNCPSTGWGGKRLTEEVAKPAGANKRNATHDA